MSDEIGPIRLDIDDELVEKAALALAGFSEGSDVKPTARHRDLARKALEAAFADVSLTSMYFLEKFVRICDLVILVPPHQMGAMVFRKGEGEGEMDQLGHQIDLTYRHPKIEGTGDEGRYIRSISISKLPAPGQTKIDD